VQYALSFIPADKHAQSNSGDGSRNSFNSSCVKSENWIRLYRRTECVSFAVSLALPLKEMLSDWSSRESAAPRFILPAKQTPHYRCWQEDTVLITASELTLHVHLSTLPRTPDRVDTITRIWEGTLGVWCPERARIFRLAPGSSQTPVQWDHAFTVRLKRPGFEAKNWPPSSVEAKCEKSYKPKPPTFLIDCHKESFAVLPNHLVT
jgi:hypothetical protein